MEGVYDPTSMDFDPSSPITNERIVLDRNQMEAAGVAGVAVLVKKNNLLKDLTPSGDDLREGLTAIVSVKIADPQFNNQTKEKLLNQEAEGFVSQLVADGLGAWLDQHPNEAKQIAQKRLYTPTQAWGDTRICIEM